VKNIKRVIVESMNGTTVVNNPLKAPVTEAELRVPFQRLKLPILSVVVDTVGTALVKVGKNYYG